MDEKQIYEKFLKRNKFKSGPAPDRDEDFLANLRKENPFIPCVVFRSVNLNVMCFEVRMTDKGTIDPKNPVKAYWLMVDPESRKERKGTHDRAKVEFKESLAWAYETELVDPLTVKFSFEVFPQHTLYFRWSKKNQRFQAYYTHENERLMVQFVYVNGKDNVSLYSSLKSVRTMRRDKNNFSQLVRSHIFSAAIHVYSPKQKRALEIPLDVSVD